MPCAPPHKALTPVPASCHVYPATPLYPCLRAPHKHSTHDRQAMIHRGQGKRALAHMRTRRPALQLPHGAALPAQRCSCAPPVDRHAWPAHAERFTEVMPVTFPKMFHGCETHGGVHTSTTRRRSASMRCVQRRARAALPPVQSRRCPKTSIAAGGTRARRKFVAPKQLLYEPLDCCRMWPRRPRWRVE
jgi:hypothetical protein